MLNELAFYGSSQFKTISSPGVTQLRDEGKVVRINATVAGVVVQLPSWTDFRNAPCRGGVVFTFYGVSTSADYTIRSPDGNIDRTITSSQKYEVYYFGISDAVIRQVGQAPAVVTTRMQGIVGPASAWNEGQPIESMGWYHLVHPAETWNLSSAPTPRAYATTACYKKSECYVAGRGQSFEGENTIDRWNRNGTWTALSAKLSDNRLFPFSGVYRTAIYFFGGSTDIVDRMQNPETTMTISRVRALPIKREKASSVVGYKADRILVAYGNQSELAPWTFHGPSETYEMVKAPTSLYREGPSAFIINGDQAHFCGGNDPSNMEDLRDTVDVYNFSSRVWSLGPVILTPISTSGSFQIGDAGYLCGGHRGAALGEQNIVQRFRAGVWTGGPPMPGASAAMTDAGNQAESA